MNTQEHLNRIKSKCQELLAIAENRTAGKWITDSARGVMSEVTGWMPICYPFGDKETELKDATFIASCAGAAEAGWRATIAAIDELTALNDESCLYDGHEGQHTHRLSKLIAAWPEELL
jgi:hypothetical protein